VRLRPIRSALTEILIENESMVEILSPDFGRIFGLSRRQGRSRRGGSNSGTSRQRP
jgi:hypothetical protein